MLAQVDHVIVGDNSTDGTQDVLRDLVREGLPVTVLDDPLPNFRQSEVMNEYAQRAADRGASWVVPFDMDEAWYAVEGRIADRLAELPAAALLVPAANLTHGVTALDDVTEPDPMTRMEWRSTSQLPLPKVACRPLPTLEIAHGNHSASYRGIRFPLSAAGVLQARHFPYRSADQFVKRVEIAWPMLRDSGLQRSHGIHMWEYGELLDRDGPDGLRDWFQWGMTFHDPESDPNLVRDPLPAIDAFQ